MTQLLTKYKATNVRKDKQGLRLQKRRARKGPSGARRRRTVPGYLEHGGWERRCGACLCGSTGKYLRVSKKVHVFFGSRPLAG